MNLNELKREVEDKAVEYLNEGRLESLEEMALNQLNKSANNGYVRLRKLEFSALLNSARGLQRVRQQQKDRIAELESERNIYRDNEMKACKRVDSLESELAQARQQVAEAVELVHELRPKHDVYDRVRQQLRIKNDVLGHVRKLESALKLAMEALENLETVQVPFVARELASRTLAEIRRLEENK